MERYVAILAKCGVDIAKDARILDFGCGSGARVYSLLDQGWQNVLGYDVKDYLALREPADRARFFMAHEHTTRLPFSDHSFDLIISEQVFEHVQDQVLHWRELHRITRPGGCSIHVFPARYSPIEPHIYVPFGGFFGHRWWYWLWASMGVRNEYQAALSASEVADRNAFYFVESLRYVPNSCLGVVWRRLGYRFIWIDQENFDASENGIVRFIGRVNRIVPIIGWLNRTFHTRRVVLFKVSGAHHQPGKLS